MSNYQTDKKRINFFSLHRTVALTIHYLHSAKRSPIRIIEVLIWPSLELVIFVFLTYSIQREEGPSRIALAIVAGILFWNFFTRIIQEIVGQFLDDILSKNVHNLLITPVSIVELYISLLVASMIKLLASMTMLLITLSIFFPSFVSEIGVQGLIWAIPILVFASTVGLVILATIFVFGNRMASIAWFISAVIQPFSCVVYERDVLPPGMKELSFLNPTSYVFEMIRTYYATGYVENINLYIALGISGMYILISLVGFRTLFNYARSKGSLMNL